jgi:phage baseplate assembly protein gpV
MNMPTIFSRLFARIDRLEKVVSRQAVQLNNIFREGTVVSVDEENARAVVNAHGIESQPIPWLEQAGDIVEWNPPSKDQRVLIAAPGGDMSRAVIMPGGFTESTPAPHNKGATKRTKIAGAVITHTADGLEILVDGASYVFTKDALVITNAGIVGAGGEWAHNGKNIGSDHRHENVQPGIALSGPPHDAAG